MKNFSFLFVIALVAFFSASSLAQQKLSAQEIVAKHLDSIGSKEKRASIKNQVLFGDVNFKYQGSTTPVGGRVVIVSSNEKNLWGMNLNSNDYPQERFGYNGKESRVGYVRPGTRSILGVFIFSCPELLKDGLLGGSLTSSWALLNVGTRNPKLSYEGTKKVGDKEAYVLSYSPKGGSDLSIRMYFDTENFHHLRTEYTRVIGARIGTGGVDASASQGEDRYRLIEDFSEFKDAGGLTLPTKYKLYYSYFSNAPTKSANQQPKEAEWQFNIANFSYNQQIDDTVFVVENS